MKHDSESGFNIPVFVGNIVNGINNIEGVNLGSSDVRGISGSLGIIVGVVEDARGRLSTGGGGGALVGDGVVSAERSFSNGSAETCFGHTQ